MAKHRTGTREEWEAAREKLLEREKELTRLNDELARQRSELPWVPIGKEYSFEVNSFLESGASPQVSKFASECGTDPAGFLQEGPGLTAFALADGKPHMTYATTARGLEPLMVYYAILDRAPLGRNEGDPPEPWLRRHDEYAVGG